MTLRPKRSPKCPKMIPPRGRAANPTPNAANDASVPARGSSDGKNNTPKTSADAVPKTYMSKNSIHVPMKLAKATL